MLQDLFENSVLPRDTHVVCAALRARAGAA